MVAPYSKSRDGNRSLHRSRGRVTSLKLSPLYVGICAGVGFGSVAYGQQAGGDEQLEEVVVTGSRIVRRDLDAPSPILTVDTEVFRP